MPDIQSMMWIILDLITVLMAFFTIVHYARKGFIQSLYSALKWFLSLLLIRWLFGPITLWLKTLGLETYLTGVFESWIASAGSFGSEEFIDGLPLPKAILEYLKANNNLSVYAQMGVNNALSFVAATLADIVVNLVAILGLLVVFRILFFIVGKLLNLITHLPVIHSLNGLLGGLLGVILAFLFVCIFGAGLYVAAGLAQKPELLSAMEETKILSVINQHNFLLDFASKIPFKE